MQLSEYYLMFKNSFVKNKTYRGLEFLLLLSS